MQLTPALRKSARLAALALLAAPAAAQSQLWSQSVDNFAKIESSITPFLDTDEEAADDFDIIGQIERVRVAGGLCFGCSAPDVVGVHVRFYAWDQGAPGALLQQQFLAADDPRFTFDPLDTSVLDVELPVPFVATGKHFVSVQLEVIGPAGWSWWTAGDGQTAYAPLHWRDNTAGEAFAPYAFYAPEIQRDLAFELWGEGIANPAPIPELVWAQNSMLLAPTLPAGVWPGQAAQPEIADDFEFVGDIHQFMQQSAVCYQCAYPDVTGARVRIYEWTEQGPGAVQYDAMVAPGDGGVEFEGLLTYTTLPEPFVATGKHYFSVQLFSNAPTGYELRTGGDTPENLAPVAFRTSDSAPFQPYMLDGAPFGGDTGFWIYGVPAPTGPPVVVGDACGPWAPLDVPYPAQTSHSILRGVKVFGHDQVFAVGTRSVQGATPLDVTGGTVSYAFDGHVWTELDTPSPEPYPGAGGVGLEAVDGVSPTDLWAAGYQKLQGSGGFVGTQVLALHWDGSDWTVVDTPLTPGVDGTLQGTSGGLVRGIEALASDDVWFVGDWNKPFACRPALAMHWDGSSFSVVDTPCSGLPSSNGGFGLEAVSGVASDDVWAVGGGGSANFSLTGPYVIHWDGQSWTHFDTPMPGLTRRLFAVEAIASDDVWAVGQYQDFDGFQAYAIHWDGSVWSQVAIPGGSLGLWAASSNEVYAVGSAVYKWDGVAWQLADDLGQLTGDAFGVAFADVDGADGCAVHAVGRHTPAGKIVPFSARPLLDWHWAVSAREGCDAVVLEDTLRMVYPPALGADCVISLGELEGPFQMTPGATRAWWLISTTPGTSYPCGDVVPGYGPGGATGELMIDVGALWSIKPLGTWGGPQSPLTVAVSVPASPALSGLELFTQGLMVDAAGPVLTNALDLRLGQ